MIESISPASSLLAFGLPGHGEWIILLILGLLIFGRRLPEVGRSLGRGIVEFKRGIRGIEDEIEDESGRSSAAPERLADRSNEATVAPTPSEPVAAKADDASTS
ncbi:MAG: Sec-independent protein translocase subunit TatA/TatB [Planctomycetota bacterium]|jgi:sec-independent protein translocase protein TatA